MRPNMKNNNEQGTALIATLIFLLAMGVLSTALVFTVNSEMKTSASYKYNQQAFYLAESGVQEAVRWFSDPSLYEASTYLGQWNLSTLPPGFGSGSSAVPVAIGQSGSYSDGPTALLTIFRNAFNTTNNTRSVGSQSSVYTVSAKLLRHTPAHFISATVNSETPDGNGGYNSAVERWQIEAVGYWGSVSNPLGMARVTAIIENDGDAFFDRALWGIDGVNLTGTTLIDSYDPRFPYGSSNSGNLGAIGTNGDITGGGSAQVKGTVACMAGQTCDPPSQTDAVITLSEPRTFNPIEPFTTGSTKLNVKNKESDSFDALDGRYSSVTVASGGILTIPAGVWYMDSLDVKGDIIVTGDATLYIASSMDVSAQSIVNSTGSPKNLNVFYTGTTDSKWTGGVDVTATVYSPNAGLTLRGSAAFFGSFVAKSIDNAGGAEVHFDQGALKRNLIRRPFRIITWSRNSL